LKGELTTKRSCFRAGRYSAAAGGKASVCSSRSATANSTAVFIGTPRPPLAFWRLLAAEAGVHLYTDGSTTDDEPAGLHADTVEAAASGLLFHAGVRANASAFTTAVCAFEKQASLCQDNLLNLRTISQGGQTLT